MPAFFSAYDVLNDLYVDYSQVAYSFVDAEAAAARSHIDSTADVRTTPAPGEPH